MGLEPHSGGSPTCTRLPAFLLVAGRDHTKSIPVVLTGSALQPNPKKNGVDDGTRTHDDRDHNPGLYQLSYAHHGFAYLTRCKSIWRARQDSNLQPSA